MIVIALLLFPVLVGIGGVILAALLGGLLEAEGRQRHQGSELIELNT